MLRAFKLVTIVPLAPEEAAICQIPGLGYRPEDVRHIVLTRMHLDHAGDLPDFPPTVRTGAVAAPVGWAYPRPLWGGH